MRLHFGLGQNASADTIEIRWPTGAVETLHNVRGDRVVMVKETQ